jgi:hypothetical protein
VVIARRSDDRREPRPLPLDPSDPHDRAILDDFTAVMTDVLERIAADDAADRIRQERNHKP